MESAVQLHGARQAPAASLTLTPVDAAYKGVTGSVQLTGPADPTPRALVRTAGCRLLLLLCCCDAAPAGVGPCRG